MRTILLVAAAILAASPLPLPAHADGLTELHPLKLDVPSSSLMLPAGPGADVTNGNCLACHSADHVLNQPYLTKEAWEEVVQKMITAYKDPISQEDAAAIVDYLARIKGPNQDH
jgi:hypothetical protein